MSKMKKKTADRILSIVLALIMVIGMTPMASLANTATYPEDFTVTVNDSSNDPLDDVIVLYEISVNDVKEKNGSVTTDSNGEAAIEDLKDYSTNIQNGDMVEVSYTASKTGYVTQSGTITVTDAIDNLPITMEEEPLKTFTVSVIKNNEGGTVLLNDENVSTKDFEENSEVVVSITPNVGYQIANVSIAGEEKTVSDVTSYSETIIVTDNIEIKVSFVKTYTLTISYDSTSGSVESDPACIGGSVTVKTGTVISITATPEENYRVAKVAITGKESIEFSDNTYTNEHPYSFSLTADNDYTVEVTFAPILLSITVNTPSNGSITVDKTNIDYNGSYEATITPETGYTIDTITINTEDVYAQLEEKDSDENAVILAIENVVEDQSIEVSFKKCESATMNDVTWNSNDALRVLADGKTYIFAKNANVTFGTARQGIRITFSDGTTVGGKSTQSVAITETKTIAKIELRYDFGWHNVEEDGSSVNLKVVLDETALLITFTPEEANSYGYYNDNVSVGVKVEDPEDYYSGLQLVEYWVTSDGEITQSGTLYSYNEGDEIKSTYDGNILVKGIDNNSDNVIVTVRVEDRAGNDNTDFVNLKINTAKPTISVSIDGQLHEEASTGYYNSTRTAEITIIDRASCFDESIANDGITIEAVNGQGAPVAIAKAAMISWSHDGDTHIGKITFDTDATYSWDITYTNKADLTNEGKVSESGDSIYNFTVDKTAPTAKISLETDTWDKLLSTLTFGVWKNYPVTVTAEGNDVTSPLYDILYYKSNTDSALTETELVQLYESGKFVDTEYTVKDDELFAVYARITDYAGNTLYIGTNGVIVDMTDGKITLTPDEPNENGFYNKDVNVAIEVNEEVNLEAAYSGIKTVDYKVVINEGTDEEEITQQGNLFTFDVENPTKEQLLKKWNGSFTVLSAENNSDSVKVIVTVVDNAGNDYSEYITLAINVTKPKITVSFDGDEANKIVDDNGYFAQDRIATITIIDRASTFNETAATEGINIDAVDVDGKQILLDTETMISAWTHDGNKHTATINFSEDANYTWSISYTNDADETNESVNTEGCVTPFKFTVDKNKPSGSITVDKNTWKELLSILTFGLYKNEKVDVSATAEDATSPVTIEYYKTSEPNILHTSDLDKICEAKQFVEFEGSDLQKNGVSPNEQFVIYLKITDYAGNYIYINSDGYILDDAASEITLTETEANKNGLYNTNVDVSIKITDEEPYSGIKTIDYWVEKDNQKTQEGNLYTFSVSNPTQADLLNEWNGSIEIDAALNNSCNVVVYVKTVDNANNENINSIPLDIDVTAPAIKITYTDKSNVNAKEGYYTERTATIVITERTHHFDEVVATDGIVITAKDAKGKSIENAYTISEWITVEGATPDEATHTATITFDKDANYTFDISYTDKADNENTIPDVTGQKTPYEFTVDTTAPEGTVTALSTEGRSETWSDLVDPLTFGFWSNKKISISCASDDATSPIASVQYYMPVAKKANDATTALDKEALDNVTTWQDFSKLDITENMQFVVYIRIIDNAGNYTYIGTNGLIVDDQHPVEESVAPEITVRPEQPINGIYRGDVKVSISVDDPMVGGTYSGLKEITYKVFDRTSATPNQATQEGTLYRFNNTNPKQEDLLKHWSGEITVDSSLNNSNDIQIVVYAVDNAGNTVDNSQKTSKSYTSIKIDTTAPVINISYNNNSADSNNYFKADRVATIVITERNFNPDDVKITITNTDGIIPAVIGWSDVAGTYNKDNSTHTATVSYTADGDYTFAIEYTDMAGNRCTSINYAQGTVAGTEFTIDKTIPTISVSYDNNSAQNNNYYKEARVATIVINEHNFSADRVTVTISATDNGVATTVPSISGWSTRGNTHTATINYPGDALYTFDISYTDMAGNNAADYAQDVFYVDKTAPVIEITGVVDKSANNGDIIPVIRVTDTNFNKNAVSIILNGVNNGNDLNYAKTYADIANGQTITYANFRKVKDVDDLYTLTVTLTDMAGNETTQTITFSANRFGSVYDLSGVKDMMNKYLQNEKDLVFTETNVDSLKRDSVRIILTKNGTPIDLVEGQDYTVVETGGDGRWSQYQYTIKKELFADDGTYSIAIYSVDAAGNINENIDEDKDAEIFFGIDKTKPVVIAVDFESGKQYAVENKIVSVEIKDNLILEGVKIYLNDKEIEYSVDGETYTFIIPQSNSLQNVRIVAVDAAGNETELLVENFLVSTNLFARWYNNTPLFIGSIIGFIIIIIAIIAFLLFGKRKKEKA